jgi:hypothetical protein
MFTTSTQQQQQQDGSSVQLQFSPQGSSTTFTYDAQQQLNMQTVPCEWSGHHIASMVQVELPDWTYSRLPADMTVLVTGGGGDNMQAAGLAASGAVAGGGDAGASGTGSSSGNTASELVFELGTVLADGSLARWLLVYDAAGGRLLKRAAYELYPSGAGS